MSDPVGRDLLLDLLGETEMEIQGNTLVKGVNEFDAVIPEGVEIIGVDAFRECTRLTSVVFPSTLKGIGTMAFYECTRLTSVTLPEGLTSIGNGAFQKCTRLTSVTFPEGLTSIGARAFKGCSGLTRVVFPSTLISIGTSAFYGCSGLTRVVFPSTLTSIGDGAFYGCSGLASVDLSSTSLTSIRELAFSQCTGLTSVDLTSTSLTRIEWSAFRGCTSLNVLVPPCQVHPTAFTGCLLVLNASGSNIPGSIDINPRIVGLRQRLLEIWSANVRRQGRLRQSSRGYRAKNLGASQSFVDLYSAEERIEVERIWREIKKALGTYIHFDLGVFLLFRKIIEGGRKLVQMKSYLNQPKETKVFKKVLDDLGIEEPRRFRNWQGRLESQLRF